MKKARDMLRKVAVSLMACAAVVAASAPAHAQHFSALAGLRGSATPSSGVIMISAERPYGGTCTGSYTPAPIEYSAGDQRWGQGSGLIDGYIRFYNWIGLGDTYEWPQFIPATLRPLLHNVNFSLPTARDIASVGYDLETAYYQGLRSAGCEAETVGMAPLRPADRRAAAPEPATWAMLILGVAMVGLAARRRRQGAVAAPLTSPELTHSGWRPPLSLSRTRPDCRAA